MESTHNETHSKIICNKAEELIFVLNTKNAENEDIVTMMINENAENEDIVRMMINGVEMIVEDTVTLFKLCVQHKYEDKSPYPVMILYRTLNETLKDAQRVLDVLDSQIQYLLGRLEFFYGLFGPYTLESKRLFHQRSKARLKCITDVVYKEKAKEILKYLL